MRTITRDDVIYVAGHTGLAGSAILRRLRSGGYEKLLVRSHRDLDLTDQRAVLDFYSEHRPICTIVAAARVGGILANSRYRADFISQNVQIAANVIGAAYRYGCEKLLFLGSSCIYPRDAAQPMREEYLLTGSLEPTNEPYAVAKIAGIKLCSAYAAQYAVNFFSLMPTNLYGPNDTFNLESSHVLPALMQKIHDAKVHGRSCVEIWGTGEPRREFLHSDDLADACVFLLEKYTANEIGEFVNVGSGEDIRIIDLAALIAEVVGYVGEFSFNPEMPDGPPRKLLDCSRICRLGWRPRIALRDGIAETYRSFLEGKRNR